MWPLSSCITWLKVKRKKDSLQLGYRKKKFVFVSHHHDIVSLPFHTCFKVIGHTSLEFIFRDVMRFAEFSHCLLHIVLFLFFDHIKAGVPLPDYLMVWQIGWKIRGKIGQWERKIGWSDAILNRMESEGLWHVIRSDGSHPITHFYHCAKCIVG